MAESRMLLKIDKSLEKEIKEYLEAKGANVYTPDNPQIMDQLYHLTGDLQEEEIERVIKNQLKKIVAFTDGLMKLTYDEGTEYVLDFQKEFYKGVNYVIYPYDKRNMNLDFNSIHLNRKNHFPSQIKNLIYELKFYAPENLELDWSSVESDTYIEIFTPKIKKILTIKV
jgi:hypothetical protein